MPRIKVPADPVSGDSLLAVPGSFFLIPRIEERTRELSGAPFTRVPDPILEGSSLVI